jgi:CheY-like chemotaxis protein/two-component sensor histidine kinase
MISTSADRMDALIRDALDYNRAVRQELPLEDVDTGALLRGMLNSYPELQPSRANIQLEGRLPVVLGNEAALTQSFSNLLGNAVKFVKPGQRPEIRVWAEEREGWARIWVEDKGIGISKDMLARVFDMFSRGSKSYEGTGIGLALVRKVTQRMGGRAGVESQEGQGSRFWLELKAGEMKESPKLERWARSEPTRGTVLYVEDEESDALFMERAFAEKGLASALQVVGDGRAAIDYLSGAGKYGERSDFPLPTVVLLDLNLPQVPGFEVLRWMRNHPDFAATPVVVFSSSTREDDRAKARQLGANEFVTKPKSGMDFGGVVEMLREKWLGAPVS